MESDSRMKLEVRLSAGNITLAGLVAASMLLASCCTAPVDVRGRVRDLDSPEKLIRWNSASQLARAAKCGKDIEVAVSALKKALDDPDGDVRKEAAKALKYSVM